MKVILDKKEVEEIILKHVQSLGVAVNTVNLSSGSYSQFKEAECYFDDQVIQSKNSKIEQIIGQIMDIVDSRVNTDNEFVRAENFDKIVDVVKS